jgi:protein-export membrane protein SecD/preprotein translocase SecF subunit
MRLVVVLALIVISALIFWQKSIERDDKGQVVKNPDGRTAYKTPIPLGLDLRGGSELQYRIRTETVTDAKDENIAQRVIDTIRRRVDPDGRMELDIRPRGNDRFYIQLPGMSAEESRRIEDLIRRAGKLRFCLVSDKAEDIAKAGRGERVPGYTPFLPVVKAGKTVRWHRGTFDQLTQPQYAGARDWYLVENSPRVTGEWMTNPHPTEDETGMPAVGFGFRGQGRLQFERLTEENRGRMLAIILDEDLYSAPSIRSRISGSGIITGHFTRAEVNDLVSILRAGQLPADIELEWNNTVGAQLGEDSIRSGIRASLISLILVLIFMAVYYFVTGMVANLAVVLNLIITLALMAGMQSVLTLPGIAGLVLTLGMAVDANVLINERIREESERGKTLRLAIRAGYERAFITILDSNLTTIIAGLILFGVGAGPVRGFAVTLTLGIAISMFTSVWVTRWIIEFLVERGWLTKLHMFKLLSTPSFPFSKYRHICLIASIVGIVGGFIVFALRGEDKYDTDLTGGFRAVMELKKGVPIGEFRERVDGVFKNADVQSIWSSTAAQAEGKDPTLFSIRVRRLTDEQKREKLRDDIAAALKDRNLLGDVKESKTVYQYEVRTAAPVNESLLRDALAGRRYTESTIRDIVLPGKAQEFVVKFQVSNVSDDDTISKLLKSLDAQLASQSVRVTIGDFVREEDSRSAAAGEIVRGYVVLKLGEACSTAAVREALAREVFGGSLPAEARVSGHGVDAGAEIAREMVFRAKENDVQRVRNSQKKELKIIGFSAPVSGELRLSLSEPLPESVVSDKFVDAGVSRLVRAVIPVGIKSDSFLVMMHELSDEKAAERIREQLLALFKAETADDPKAAPAVTLTAGDAPAYYPGDPKAGGAQFFKVAISRELTIQDIRGVLRGAGLPDVLIVQGDANTGAVANRKVAEVFVRLTGSPAEVAAAQKSISEAFRARFADPFRSLETIGPVVAGELKNKAILAVILSWVAMIFYLWFRFGEIKFGLAAVIALIHDVLFTLGCVGVADALSGTAFGNTLGLSDIKMNVTMVAAFLTLVGYSVNDTIVVFDRIRENMGGVRRRVDAEMVDTSVNQTLSRTILTALTVFIVVVVLYVVGGPVIHGFAFVMVVGTFVGCYSSVFIAAPILIDWDSYVAGLRKALRIVTFRGEERR